MARHTHQFTIADDEAVRALIHSLTAAQRAFAVRNSCMLSMTPHATTKTPTNKCAALSSMDCLPAMG